LCSFVFNDSCIFTTDLRYQSVDFIEIHESSCQRRIFLKKNNIVSIITPAGQLFHFKNLKGFSINKAASF